MSACVGDCVRVNVVEFFLGVLEAQLFEQAVKKKMIPTMMPVKASYNPSGFGRRVDPFNGQWAMHEGIDLNISDDED